MFWSSHALTRVLSCPPPLSPFSPPASQADEAEKAGDYEAARKLRDEADEEEAKGRKDPKALSKRVCY